MKFGIEMEMIGITADMAQNAIRNAGIAVEAESYNHTTKPWWKIVQDSSLRDNEGRPTRIACEVVSPVLDSEIDGFEQIEKVCNAVLNAGAKVNKSCGLHVHLDAREMSLETVKNIYRRYNKFETQIDSFMPESRRANFFCKSAKNLSRKIEMATSIEGLAYAIEDRYLKVNVQSYLRHGTVEFRQHSGTVEGKKVTMWVKFLMGFVNAAANPVAETREIQHRGAKLIIKNFVVANRGTLSIQQMESALRTILAERQMTVSDGHLKTYVKKFSKPEVSIGALFDGIGAEIAAYYQNRSVELARRIEIRRAAAMAQTQQVAA